MLRPLLLLLVTSSLSFAQSSGNSLSAFSNGAGVQGEVNAVVAQADGRVIIGGQFSAVNGIAVSNIARINADGTLDRTFSPTTEAGTNGPIFALGLQTDGKVVAGGLFSQAGSLGVMNLARFNGDGSVDKDFGGSSAQLGANAVVLAIAIAPDGKIVIGGSFNIVQGQPRRGLARLNIDGTLDTLALPSASLSGTVKAVAVLPSAGFIASGIFSVQGNEARGLVSIPK